jgi:serine/threonine-protein kinase RsbW
VTETSVELTFPAKADYLLLSRLALSGLARAYPLEADVLADLKLAVTEACGNAVQHAYDTETGPVTVVFRISDDLLEILVEDRGSGLTVEPPEEWVLPEQLEGGMGMAIIRAVVDELSVDRGSGGTGTVVRMAKRLSPADDLGAES